ncbi:hypothetical protein HDZ31DRAFT_49377 [Schizophyllum fasciatum]
MLKRRRAASPPPPSHEVPLLPPSPPRDLKRRRTQPPVLDGQQRTGAVSFLPYGHTADGLADDMGEEPWDEEDDENDRVSQPTVDPVEYKSANDVLYELHALQRHRLLFAPTQAATGYLHRNHQQPSVAAGHPFDQCPPSGKGVGYLLPDHRAPSHSSRPAYKNGAAEVELSMEEQRVKERYEGANRTLGALFLSRRREAESEDYPRR